jgi:hypothetical protein
MRKAQHLQPKASDVADAEVGCFALSRLAAHIRVLSKSGEKPTLQQNDHFLDLAMFADIARFHHVIYNPQPTTPPF